MIDCLKHFVFNTTNVPLTCKALYKNFREYSFDDIAKHIIKYKGYFNKDYYNRISKNAKLYDLEVNDHEFDYTHILNHIDLFGLENLVYINLSHAGLETIYISPNSLKKLSILDLSANNIDNFIIPKNALLNITKLDLRYNCISKICFNDNIFNNLEVLFLNSNNIQNIELNSIYFPKLNHLELQGNQLKTIKFISHFLFLEKLDLSYNDIESISFLPNSFPNLIQLYLNNNKLTNLNLYDTSFSKLEILTLKYNYLNQKVYILKELLKTLKYLELDRCDILDLGSCKIEFTNH